ncbi:hypothetical protein Tco_1517595 [Tanacetum coccineum]
MNQAITQQATLDEALVSTDDRVEIGKCNMRINPTKTQEETTYQVALDILKLSLCYNVFLILADLDNNKFKIGVELFREILRICPRVPYEEFVAPPPHDAIVTFIKSLGKNVDYVELLWEDFKYQIDYRKTTRESMPYPRFTKHDVVLGRLKFVGKCEDNQVYGMLILDVMINNDIKISKAYQNYLGITAGVIIPKKARKGMKTAITQKKKSFITVDEDIVPDPEKARKRPTGSSEGVGITPEVPDEPKGKSMILSEGAGSETKSEIANDKEKDADDKDINEGKIEWLLTDDEKKIDDDEVHEEETLDEEMQEDDEEKKDNDQKEKVDEEQKENEQAMDGQAKDDQVGALLNVTYKEKPELLLSTSSHSLSSNYGNQFLNNSSDISLIGTILRNAYAEINSLLDVQIQQEIPMCKLISSMRSRTNYPKFLPKAVSDLVNLGLERMVCNVLQKTPALLALSYSTLGQSSSRATECLSEYELKNIHLDKMDKSRSYMTHDNHQELYDALLNLICLDDAITRGDDSTNKALRKRDSGDDQDPTA